jgi:hypothetical protein
MIIGKLSGGLGNQMFQYALGRRLALKNNVPLKLDISEYNKKKLREYDLSHFNIIENFATPKNLRSVTFPSNKPGSVPFIKLYQHIFHLPPIPYTKERTINFHPEILTLGDNTYFDGYWQSERYFSDIKDVIRKEFTVKNKPDPINESFIEKITACESVNVHIRRGDYVSNPTTNQVHGSLDLEYYHKALKLMLENIDNPHFFVFSDDPEWAEWNIKTDAPITYIKHNGAKNYEDMRLMSTCKHHIIANSSFSWWGAWLASNENKIVIGPSKWFREIDYNDQDRMPESWLRI